MGYQPDSDSRVTDGSGVPSWGMPGLPGLPGTGWVRCHMLPWPMAEFPIGKCYKSIFGVCRFSVFFLLVLFFVVVFANLRVVSDRLSELHADLTCLGVKLGGNM